MPSLGTWLAALEVFISNKTKFTTYLSSEPDQKKSVREAVLAKETGKETQGNRYLIKTKIPKYL